MSDAPQPAIGLTIRRVAGGARLVGLAWMLTLVLIALVRDDVGRPFVAWSLVIAATIWGAVMVAHQLGTASIDPLWVTVGDALLAAFALLAPGLASASDLFYGGYPGISVVAAAARSRRSGWAVAVWLSAITVVRFQVETIGAVLERLSSLITYLMLAGIVGWAVHVIFRTDEARLQAEEAKGRAEERSEVATHLHDSVLQTLALIQREADQPDRVVGLARRQERELRDWLFGMGEMKAGGLAEAVRAIAADVEDAYGTQVDLVLVGDVPYGTKVEALAGAAREALINAAKHSGDKSVSVFVEATAGVARVFIRDRGQGFDHARVPSDRRGVRDSIEGRLSQVGGVAQIRTAPGQGTEVRLEVPIR
ncbi:MAG TPA: ATP-binding protein [Acidimicrobiia bacterium]